MRVEVTQEDIDQGLPMMSGKCPVALALKRTTDRQWHVATFVASSTKPTYQVAILPAPVGLFVNAFDEGRGVNPFTFDFDWSPTQ